MATTTKVLATASRYGHAGNASYTNSGRLYVGTNDNNSNYRARITFPSLRSIAAIGDANVVITKITLVVRRDSGYNASTVVIGPSADGSWGAVRDDTASLNIPAKTAWYTFDITHCAEAILNYSNSWYIHMTSSGSQARFNGVDDTGGTPYINVVWEYAASTITTGTESSELGTPVTFTITPEDGYSSYSLSYEFGDESGVIAETSDASIVWTPPLRFASEIPNSDSGEVKITMYVFNSEGTQIRTEILYLTVTVPESAAPTITDMGISFVNALKVKALSGKTFLIIKPVMSTANSYGATIKNLKITVTDGSDVQTFTYDSVYESDANVLTVETPSITNVLLNVGDAVITFTITDSRNRIVEQSLVVPVYAYSNPVISKFSVSRYEPVYDANEQIIGYTESDVGENVWVTLKANCADVVINGVSENFMTCKIIATDQDGVETEYTIATDVLSVDISNDRTIIANIVPPASTVNYVVSVTDDAHSYVPQYDTVTPGRANFALAASKYGASFGCLPKGTEENPMLESAYPIYAYGGIDGVTKAKRTVLWTNPKPNDGMEGNTIINLSSGDYDELIIYYKSTNAGTTLQTARVLKGYTAQLITMRYPSNIQVAYRSVGAESETQLKVAAAYGFDHKDNLISTADAKIVCVPYQIIGIKYS